MKLSLVEPISQLYIDHNLHTFRKAAITDDGKPKYNKVYSKISRNWRITAVKEPKTYNFWPTLATRILKKGLMMKTAFCGRYMSPKIILSILLSQLPSSLFLRQAIWCNNIFPGLSLVLPIQKNKLMMTMWAWNNMMYIAHFG